MNNPIRNRLGIILGVITDGVVNAGLVVIGPMVISPLRRHRDFKPDTQLIALCS